VLEDLREFGPVEAVHGNMDDAALRRVLPAEQVVEAEGLRIGLVHDPGPRHGRHERLRAAFPGCDVVVYGHTHLPEAVPGDDVWIVNPGSPTERRRAPTHTMAVIRDGFPQLVEIAR
jgi:putative phosphoesterase